MPDLVQEDLDVVDLLAASAGGGAGGRWEGQVKKWDGQAGKVGGAGRESGRGRKRREDIRKRAASA